MSTCRILLVEDDKNLNQQLSELMMQAGYQVDHCFDGEQALLDVTNHKPDLVLLDVMLPKRDGFSVLNIIRKTSQVPVIMLSAKNAEQERITGLSQGADDYVTKPFSRTELMLRIEALLRRTAIHSAHTNAKNIQIDGLTINSQQQTAYVGQMQIELTPIQYKILAELCQHQGEVLSKAYLSQRVLRKTLGAHDRSLDMHVSRIRRKLTAAGWFGDRIETVHGKGYCLA
ncbi:two component transcriptional regulator [Catenovulum agarivorans DS-2]|uniref:Two component transcriptional regulator n=1 Tax=Catenovulum agarivorans DS-2 TaxID=1328313 RepID=W7R0F0_9ALTE|nr:response regulator transcription factor [Catenovulum agarivorans]EWH11080.1 two component transcriptional regulator [Catenovulum agarivorans DS-2]